MNYIGDIWKRLVGGFNLDSVHDVHDDTKKRSGSNHELQSFGTRRIDDNFTCKFSNLISSSNDSLNFATPTLLERLAEHQSRKERLSVDERSPHKTRERVIWPPPRNDRVIDSIDLSGDYDIIHNVKDRPNDKNNTTNNGKTSNKTCTVDLVSDSDDDVKIVDEIPAKCSMSLDCFVNPELQLSKPINAMKRLRDIPIIMAKRSFKPEKKRHPLRLRTALNTSFQLDEKRRYCDLISEATSRPDSFFNNVGCKPFENRSKRLVSKALNKKIDVEEIIDLDSILDLSEVQTDASQTQNMQNWLDQMNEKYKWKTNLTTKCDQVQERKVDQIINKVVPEPNKKQLQDKLSENFLRQISISEPICLEDETALPKFTSAQESLIAQALMPQPHAEILVEKFKYQITRQDVQTLTRTTWLNDAIINFYMCLIMDRNNNKSKLPKVHAMATFFYPKLCSLGYDSIRRWTRKVDIFSFDLILVPIHLAVHWCMCVIDLRAKQIRYYDSMGQHNKRCTDLLLEYLADEMRDKKKQMLKTSDWSAPELSKTVPQQMNGGDCGVFACTFAEYSARDASFTFAQEDMPYFRKKMVLEIVTGRLLL